jgi:hypothetical protein
MRKYISLVLLVVAVLLMGQSGTGRYQLTSAMTLYVNHNPAIGSDAPSNNCQGSTAPCQTIANAAFQFFANIDCRGFGSYIQVQDTGEFAEDVAFDGPRCPGLNNLQIIGNPNNPDSVIWDSNVAGKASVYVSDHATVGINGFKMQCTAWGGINVQANQQGIIDFANIDWGECGGGMQISCAAGSNIIYEQGPATTYTVSGPLFGYHYYSDGTCGYFPVGGGTAGTPVSVPNVLAFTEFFHVDHGSQVNSNLNFTGPGAGSASSGLKFNVMNYSNLVLNGKESTVPGNGGNSSPNGNVTN